MQKEDLLRFKVQLSQIPFIQKMAKNLYPAKRVVCLSLFSPALRVVSRQFFHFSFQRKRQASLSGSTCSHDDKLCYFATTDKSAGSFHSWKLNSAKKLHDLKPETHKGSSTLMGFCWNLTGRLLRSGKWGHEQIMLISTELMRFLKRSSSQKGYFDEHTSRDKNLIVRCALTTFNSVSTPPSPIGFFPICNENQIN